MVEHGQLRSNGLFRKTLNWLCRILKHSQNGIPLSYDDRTQSELDTIATDINSYVDQMMAEFIVGRTDIDAEWENYCTTLENMRLNDMLAIMQEGIDALEG